MNHKFFPLSAIHKYLQLSILLLTLILAKGLLSFAYLLLLPLLWLSKIRVAFNYLYHLFSRFKIPIRFLLFFLFLFFGLYSSYPFFVNVFNEVSLFVSNLDESSNFSSLHQRLSYLQIASESVSSLLLWGSSESLKNSNLHNYGLEILFKHGFIPFVFLSFGFVSHFFRTFVNISHPNELGFSYLTIFLAFTLTAFVQNPYGDLRIFWILISSYMFNNLLISIHNNFSDTDSSQELFL